MAILVWCCAKCSRDGARRNRADAPPRRRPAARIAILSCPANDPRHHQHTGRPRMSLTLRRVVTGHDKDGRAIVTIDEIAKNVAQTRPGANAAVIWTSEGFPVDNDDDADTSGRKVGTTLANGTVFRVVSFGPGVAPRNHRTDSIDYAVVISG